MECDETSCSLTNLPAELLIHVFCYLNLSDLKHISRTCRELKYAADHNYLWRQIFFRRYRKDEHKRLRVNEHLGWKSLFHWRNRSLLAGKGELPATRCYFNPVYHLSEVSPLNHLRFLHCIFLATDWFQRYAMVSQRAAQGMRQLASWSLLLLFVLPLLLLGGGISSSLWQLPVPLSAASSWSPTLLFAVTVALSVPASLAHVFALGGYVALFGAFAIWGVILCASELVPTAYSLHDSLRQSLVTSARLIAVAWVVWVVQFLSRYRQLQHFHREALLKLGIITVVVGLLVFILRHWVISTAALLFFIPVALMQQEATLFAHGTPRRRSPVFFTSSVATRSLLLIVVANAVIALHCIALPLLRRSMSM